MRRPMVATAALGALLAISSGLIEMIGAFTSAADAQTITAQTKITPVEPTPIKIPLEPTPTPTKIRVPEPGTFILLGASIAGLGGVMLRRRLRRKSQ